MAYAAKGEFDRAIGDYDRAIKIDPARALFYVERGSLFFAKEDMASALADYSKAIELDPKSDAAYLYRGLIKLYGGEADKGLADLTRAAELDPKDSWTALWVDIVARRSATQSPLAESRRQLDGDQWPAPIVRLYLGELAPEAVFASLEGQPAAAKKRRTCQANFYAGVLALRPADKDRDVQGKKVQDQEAPAQEAPAQEAPAQEAPAQEAQEKEVQEKLVQEKEAQEKEAQEKLVQEKEAQTREEAGKDAPITIAQDKDKDRDKDRKEEAVRLLRLAASECPRTLLEWRAAHAELKALGINE